MRTKLRLFSATIAIVALGVTASPAAATANGKGRHTLRLVATEIQSHYVDVGSPGPSLGDQAMSFDSVARKRRQVGVHAVVCTVVHVTSGGVTFQCVGTFSLRRGQITLQGLVEIQGEDDRGPWTGAITGGTGAYRGARGEAVTRGVNDTTSSYELRLDGRKKQNKR